jgi:hypothetical protein
VPLLLAIVDSWLPLLGSLREGPDRLRVLVDAPLFHLLSLRSRANWKMSAPCEEEAVSHRKSGSRVDGRTTVGEKEGVGKAIEGDTQREGAKR